MTHNAEKGADALVAVRALADRWESVLDECKAADPRWILDRSVMTLSTALTELRSVLPPDDCRCGHDHGVSETTCDRCYWCVLPPEVGQP